MENFCFPMFNNKTELFEKRGDNMITTKEMRV